MKIIYLTCPNCGKHIMDFTAGIKINIVGCEIVCNGCFKWLEFTSNAELKLKSNGN